MAKHLKWTDGVRWVFTLALLYGVFRETGIWTTLFSALIALKHEIDVIVERINIENQQTVNKILSNLVGKK